MNNSRQRTRNSNSLSHNKDLVVLALDRLEPINFRCNSNSSKRKFKLMREEVIKTLILIITLMM